MKRILSIFVLLVAVESFGEMLSNIRLKATPDIYDEISESIVRALPSAELVLVESRIDERRRTTFNGEDEENFSLEQLEGIQYLNGMPIRYVGMPKTKDPRPQFNQTGILYRQADALDFGVLDTRHVENKYKPCVSQADGLVKLAFVERCSSPWTNAILANLSSYSKFDSESLLKKGGEKAFLERYQLASFFPTRTFRIVDNLLFIVDIPQPEMPDSPFFQERSERNDPRLGGIGEESESAYERRLLSSIEPIEFHPQYISLATSLVLSRLELSEIVYLAYWFEDELTANSRYREVRESTPQVYLNVELATIQTLIGKTLKSKMQALRSTARDQQQVKSGLFVGENRTNANLADNCSSKFGGINMERTTATEEMDFWSSPHPDASGDLLDRLSFPGGIAPGWGCPGSLLECVVSPETKEKMERMHLTAGRFKWPSFEGYDFDWSRTQCPSDEVSYLLFVPKNVRGKKLPLIVFFCGLGEFGPTPDRQFRQPDIFELITSDEFQKRHPCILFAPVFVEQTLVDVYGPGEPSPSLQLASDAMYTVIRSLAPGSVDTNRLYAVGLSFGGDAALDMLCGFPGRFAAAIAVSASEEPEMFPEGVATKFWLLHNRNEYSTFNDRSELDEIRRKVSAAGGEMRESIFQESGHDAWHSAWSEPSVWNWLFKQTANGDPVVFQRQSPNVAPFSGSFFEDPKDIVCSASVPGRDSDHMPEHGADGLEATAYVSASFVKPGDWWQAEFKNPVIGRIEVFSGFKDGRDRISRGHVESSSDGFSWTRRCFFSSKNGRASFSTTERVKFIRVLSEARSPEPLVVRELNVLSR